MNTYCPQPLGKYNDHTPSYINRYVSVLHAQKRLIHYLEISYMNILYTQAGIVTLDTRYSHRVQCWVEGRTLWVIHCTPCPLQTSPWSEKQPLVNFVQLPCLVPTCLSMNLARSRMLSFFFLSTWPSPALPPPGAPAPDITNGKYFQQTTNILLKLKHNKYLTNCIPLICSWLVELFSWWSKAKGKRKQRWAKNIAGKVSKC